LLVIVWQDAAAPGTGRVAIEAAPAHLAHPD
jgi:hypothetical protein